MMGTHPALCGRSSRLLSTTAAAANHNAWRCPAKEIWREILALAAGRAARGRGENRGHLLETPARKRGISGKETLRNTSEEKSKEETRGKRRPPPPLQERARAGKDSAVAPKHGLSWTPIGIRGERYAAVALKNQLWHCVHLSICARMACVLLPGYMASVHRSTASVAPIT